MADTAEFWLHPKFGLIEHPRHVWKLPNHQQGLSHDAAWKKRGKFIYGNEFIVPTDNRWDGQCATSGQIADTKLAFTTDHGTCSYLSHSEWLEQERKNCVYPIYREFESASQLMCLFDFKTAMLHYAIRRFEGRKAKCAETGREEDPWSINLRTLRDKPGVLWFLDLPPAP